MRSIESAIILAAAFHKKQKDKDRIPYIYHPMHVMGLMDLDDLDGRKVAVLHDVVEDTNCDLLYLRAMGFADHIVEAVDAITRREGENYDDYLDRVFMNDIAKRVKLKDIEHNLARSRKNLMNAANEGERKAPAKRIVKYERALMILR